MPADTTHPVFQPRQPKDDRIKVWRHMDLPKLISLLQSESLYLARADTLDDPLEGHTTRINRLANEDTITQILAEQDSQHTRDDLRRSFGELTHTLRQNTYVSCWYSGATESALMWKAYGGGCGVVVQSTYDKLRDSLPGPEPKDAEPKDVEATYIGCVRYLDYQGSDWIPGGNAFAPYIHKRVEFEGEKEVRVICSGIGKPVDGNGIRIPIETGKIVDDIRSYPGAPGWIREMLTKLVRKYGLELDVSSSRLDAVPIV